MYCCNVGQHDDNTELGIGGKIQLHSRDILKHWLASQECFRIYGENEGEME